MRRVVRQSVKFGGAATSAAATAALRSGRRRMMNVALPFTNRHRLRDAFARVCGCT